MTESNGVAYKAGRFLPVEDATIGILDPAFTKADVVFDVVSIWDGNFFRLNDHLDRFYSSCETTRLTLPLSDSEIRNVLAECVSRAGFSRAMAWMLCTRGPFKGGSAFGHPKDCVNQFIAYSIPYYWVIPEEKIDSGAHIWIADTRRAPDVSINQQVKNYNRMDITAAQFEAMDAGADAPVLLSTDGFLTEGPGFNVWIINNKIASTPGTNLLEGVTRKTVFELCQESGIEARTEDLTANDLENAEEAFLSTTGGGVIPVTRVNNRSIGNGAPGITTTNLQSLYWNKRAAGWNCVPVSDCLTSLE